MGEHSIFRPRFDPARSIYDALVAEQQHREGRSIEEWAAAERDAVLRATNDYATKHGKNLVTAKDVKCAEISASGHIGYSTQFAHRIVDFMEQRV